MGAKWRLNVENVGGKVTKHSLGRKRVREGLLPPAARSWGSTAEMF